MTAAAATLNALDGAITNAFKEAFNLAARAAKPVFGLLREAWSRQSTGDKIAIVAIAAGLTYLFFTSTGGALPMPDVTGYLAKGTGTTYHATGKYAAVLDPLAGAESGFNTDALTGGKMPLVKGKSFSKMFLNEAWKWQAKKSGPDALGWLQMESFRSRQSAKLAGLDPFTTLNNGKTHERMGEAVLDKLGMKKYLCRLIPGGEMMRRISGVWAAVPKDMTGLSALGGIGGNPDMAAIGTQTFLNALSSVPQLPVETCKTLFPLEMAAAIP
jgi:hypothetical protein